MTNGFLDIILIVIALIAVLLMAWLVIHAMKRFYGRQHKKDGLQLRFVASLGSRERIMSLQCNNVSYLLGVTSHTITVLDKHAVQPVPINDAPHTNAQNPKE